MKDYVKPAVIIEEVITFETAHSDPQCPSGHNLPHWDHGHGLGWGHLGCWIHKHGNWNN